MHPKKITRNFGVHIFIDYIIKEKRYENKKKKTFRKKIVKR